MNYEKVYLFKKDHKLGKNQLFKQVKDFLKSSSVLKSPKNWKKIIHFEKVHRFWNKVHRSSKQVHTFEKKFIKLEK